MVPFIDVMLVLLIIFMVTAPLITPSVINLPSVDRANKQPDQPIEIVIKSDDEVQIKKDPSTGSGGTSIPMTQIGSAAKHRAGRRRAAPGGHQRRQVGQVRNRGQGDEPAQAQRHRARRPLGADHGRQVTPCRCAADRPEFAPPPQRGTVARRRCWR